MDIITIVFAAVITIVVLDRIRINKTSVQLMLLGIEITLVGIVAIVASIHLTSNEVLLLGIALITAGLIINIFGFSRK